MGNSTDTLKGRIAEKWPSIAAFAGAARLTRSQVYRVLEGEGITLASACRMADALEISLDELRELLGIERPS